MEATVSKLRNLTNTRLTLSMADSLNQVLLAYLQGQRSLTATLNPLISLALAEPSALAAFDISPRQVERSLAHRLACLQQVYPTLQAWCADAFATTSWLETLWNFWLPLALQLADCRQQQQRPIVQAVLGGQGTGKTTLGKVLAQVLGQLGYRLLSLSLDDLYKTYAERQHLQTQDPRLIWRGPPGTHDIALGLRVLDELRQAGPDREITIPRFDKSRHQGAGDRTEPEIVHGVDIILFEGWFVGCRPIPPERFEQAPAPILTAADRAFARDMNARLAEYLPLWERCDRWLVLYPTDYRLSQIWRWQAEQQMQAAGNPGMSAAEIDAFVEYFWKALHPDLFIQPLVTQPGFVDLVVEIDADHLPRRIFRVCKS